MYEGDNISYDKSERRKQMKVKGERKVKIGRVTV